ncbi:3-isopropylmalate dehydratase large subunit [Streptomyces acidiscabies]|uniref:3-isopropylmalate dehydratase large subunit n=2 Tax=Streptomyces acidiscabies TaxID=42234 RepID=A0A0L0K5X1_9ACTN|nr:3-isopropylmalate dehydratase large subunit [Streptomyces acidiscabies]MBP5935963.1 3-isopropylmalate dehydratase large subunit [Streptomyces sp. LBUM 1476]KND33188.1 isopropylmalate isomerase [Streptomyces acidiscabies]MBZ3916122.1 3-isopropylmalate dehydratase large subunit [Streptomyces acidiscabies]MDX2960514.1 3-isopropylmalate dehydratase large subunit [Streptomyces acidiscabies]MDX3017800.1 3-isopropylmalate dehydratase large subunit [Streptomyces acidiscabies]
MNTPSTLVDKLWDAHVVKREEDGSDLLYVDLHLVHEATSAQAFDGLTQAGRRARRPDLTLAVEDHNVPTDSLTITDPVAALQVRTLRGNCAEQGIRLFRHGDDRQGIVHVVGPELGVVLPGMTVVCGDSHTSTHGAFGALAFGVGTSDVEHVLATQVLALQRPRTMAAEFVGTPREDVTAKDLALALLAELGANGAHGHVLEYRGEAVRALSVEGRMTLCNMSVEAGARAGVVAPDETTLAYLRGRPESPRGADWDEAAASWRDLRTDEGATFDRTVVIHAASLTPYVTWGTNPGQAVGIGDLVPDPEALADPVEQAVARKALDYMGLTPGTPMRDIAVDSVFLGSCTNGRLEDLRAAADVLRGRTIAPGVDMLVVPGSMEVRRAAEAEGLDKVFTDAGAQWRFSGCSMCLGMNPDRLMAAQRCASTSNRNYEGRQGTGARTHLVSPALAAATAVAGRLAAPADLD